MKFKRLRFILNDNKYEFINLIDTLKRVIVFFLVIFLPINLYPYFVTFIKFVKNLIF
jgi:hypothetical protein